jgi:drug/metabolite transporter, DME family
VALAYRLYVTGLRRLTAATAATLSLAEPLVATALGIGILRERLSLPVAAGAPLLIGGLVLVSIPRPRAGAGQGTARAIVTIVPRTEQPERCRARAVPGRRAC